MNFQLQVLHMSPKHSAAEIEVLVTKAQLGDQEGFERLYDIFYDPIFRYLRFRVDDREVDDLVSEVFLKVIKKITAYKSSKTGTFSAWIFRIAHNTLVDFYRKREELLGLEDPETGKIRFDVPDLELTPDKKVQKDEFQSEIRNIVKKLPALYQEIIQLKFLDELSNREIAQITGKTEGNVRIVQMRALRELRKLFGRHE